MEALLTPESLKDDPKAMPLLKAQSQWLRSRPEYVNYLRGKGKLKAALLKQVVSSSQRFLELWDGGVDVSEAAMEARSEFVTLPTRQESRRIPKQKAPYGQPR